MNTHVNPSTMVRWPGSSYAAGGRGEVYFLSGHVSTDSDGNVVGVGDIETQCAQIWANLHVTVEAIGAKITDAVMQTIYLTDPRYREAMNAERVKYFPVDAGPAGTTVIVSGLAHPNFLAEVELVLIVPERDSAPLSPNETHGKQRPENV